MSFIQSISIMSSLYSNQQRQDLAAFLAQREVENARLRCKIAQLELRLRWTVSDFTPFASLRAKKIARLQRRRDKLTARIKPAINPAQVLALVDAVLRYPQLTPAQQRQQLVKLCKHYGIPYKRGLLGLRGPVNLQDFFVAPLHQQHRSRSQYCAPQSTPSFAQAV